jgi:hypothetical protein
MCLGALSELEIYIYELRFFDFYHLTPCHQYSAMMVCATSTIIFTPDPILLSPTNHSQVYISMGLISLHIKLQVRLTLGSHGCGCGLRFSYFLWQANGLRVGCVIRCITKSSFSAVAVLLLLLVSAVVAVPVTVGLVPPGCSCR